MPFWDSIAVGQSIASESNFGDGFRDDFNTLDIETSSAPGNRTGKWKRGFMHANMAVNGFTYGSDEGGGDNFVHAEINRERQVYDDTRKPNPTGYSPFSIVNGALKIESRLVLPAEADWARVKGFVVNPDGTNGAFLRNLPAKYTSGMVSTYGRFAGSFMRLRAKVKTPYGAVGSSADINQRSAVFPAALWTLLDVPYGMNINGDPFGDGNTTYRPARPNGGGQLLELDTDENFGESPTSVHQTTHYHPAGQSRDSSLLDASTIERVNDLRSVWRESGVDIFPDKIAFFIDGVYTKIVATPDEIRNGIPIYEPIPGAEYDPVMVSANTAKVLGRQRHANGAIRYPCHVIIMNLARDGKYPRDLARQYFNSGILLPAHSNTVSMEIDWVEARPLIVDNPDMFPMRFNGVPTAADGSTGGSGGGGGVDPGTGFTPRAKRTEPFLSYPVSAINGQTYTATADLPPNDDGTQPSPDDYTYLWSGGAGVTIVGSTTNYSVTYKMADVADNATVSRTLNCNVEPVGGAAPPRVPVTLTSSSATRIAPTSVAATASLSTSGSAQLRYRVSGSATWIIAYSATAISHSRTVTGLAESTTYQFQWVDPSLSEWSSIVYSITTVAATPNYSVPLITSFAVNANNATITIFDQNPGPLRRYDAWLDNVTDLGPSFTTATATFNNIPVDGSNHTIVIRYWDNNDLGSILQSAPFPFTADSSAQAEVADRIISAVPYVHNPSVTSTINVYNSNELASALSSNNAGKRIYVNSGADYRAVWGHLAIICPDGNPITIEQAPGTWIKPTASGTGLYFGLSGQFVNMDWINPQFDGTGGRPGGEGWNQCLYLGGYQQPTQGACRNVRFFGGETKHAFYANVAWNSKSTGLTMRNHISRDPGLNYVNNSANGEHYYIGSGGNPNMEGFDVELIDCQAIGGRAEFIDMKQFSSNVRITRFRGSNNQVHSQGGVVIAINTGKPSGYNAQVVIEDMMIRGVRRRTNGGPHYNGNAMVIGGGNVTVDGFIAFDCIDTPLVGYSQSNANNNATFTNSIIIGNGDAFNAATGSGGATAINFSLGSSTNQIMDTPNLTYLRNRYQGAFATTNQAEWTFDDFRT